MVRTFLAGALGALVLCSAAISASETPSPQTQARRVRPPAPGVTRRITVQIDPAEQARLLAAPVRPAGPGDGAIDVAAAAAAAPAAIGRYDWFWERISPGIAQSGPGRLDDALAVLAASDRVSAPRLQALQDIARASGVPILRSTIGTDVSPALVLAVIAVESAGRAEAVSSAGAAGLMQLMPDTATRFGVADRMQPEQSIAGGVKYLDWLMKEFGGDPILVLAGYNAGEGAVRTHGGVPPYPETRDYVPRVLAAFRVARGLCRTPPELISDGCVFSAMN